MRQGLAPKLILFVYLVLLMLPIYWLINMSLRTNSDIMSRLTLWPHNPTLEKYIAIFMTQAGSMPLAFRSLMLRSIPSFR